MTITTGCLHLFYLMVCVHCTFRLLPVSQCELLTVFKATQWRGEQMQSKQLEVRHQWNSACVDHLLSLWGQDEFWGQRNGLANWGQCCTNQTCVMYVPIQPLYVITLLQLSYYMRRVSGFFFISNCLNRVAAGFQRSTFPLYIAYNLTC